MWRHITVSMVLTQEELPEQGGFKKITSWVNYKGYQYV